MLDEARLGTALGVERDRRGCELLIARALAMRGAPVIARVEDDYVILDLRTVFAEQESALADALAAVLR
jgi:seryl-tRNA(Sec) selenium transferase